MKTTEKEKIRCPICRSEECKKRPISPSLFEFVCPECTMFIMHEEILHEHLHRSMKEADREIVSAAIKHHFENDLNRINIVLWHSKQGVKGLREKTISELKKEGEAIFEGLAGKPEIRC
jgi:transcription initiation factor TFIIIB Brf1 subunit/transcription initiation factor TFIIB